MERKATHPFYSHMTSDDFLNLKAVVLFIVNYCREISYFHVFKILYFAEGKHCARYGRRIMNDSFHALPEGPVPSALYDAVKIAAGDKQRTGDYPLLALISDALSVKDKYILTAKEQPDMDYLSKSDIECLTESIKENKDIPKGELSAKSHDRRMGIRLGQYR
ncbi:putative phage-associated protein [Bacteroidales bacterium Barb6XT]|nr:putative phage-associated protein [Bacteroidales bacterium Barb6XT]